jgi:hypothetical protein
MFVTEWRDHQNLVLLLNVINKYKTNLLTQQIWSASVGIYLDKLIEFASELIKQMMDDEWRNELLIRAIPEAHGGSLSLSKRVSIWDVFTRTSDARHSR